MTTATQSSMIASVIEVWKRFGVFDFLMPFLLVFAIVYGILEQTKIFGDQVAKKVHAIIALAIAMTTTLTGWFISFLTGYLPWVSVISIVVVTALMLITMFAKRPQNEKSLWEIPEFKWGAVIVIIAIGLVLLSQSIPALQEMNINALLESMGFSFNDFWGLAVFAGFIIAIVVITRTPKGEGTPKPPEAPKA